METKTQPQVANRIFLEGMELLRLRDCATTSRMGVDQGFPNTMKRLAAKGLVEAKDNGFVVTELGLLTLSQYRKELRVL